MSTQSALVTGLKDRIERTLGECAFFPLWPEVLQLDVKLRHSLEKLEDSARPARPLILAMLGGTGVGKSHLFNALLGVKDASAVSDAIRPWTSRPKLACSPRDIPDLGTCLDMTSVEVIEAPLSGIALVDCPDIDSVDRENREKTRRILAVADVVVFVTDPVKRANFEIHTEVLVWSERKRWYFVMTKADLVREELPGVRADLDRRIMELGFRASDATRFVVSCLEPNSGEFNQLRNTLLGPRSATLRSLLPLDSFLAHLRYSLDESTVRELQSRLKLLSEGEERIEAGIRLAYLNALYNPDCADAMKSLLREQVWQLAQEKVGFLMWIPVWVRNRLSALALSWSLGQMFMGRASIVGILGVGLGSLMSLLKGQAPFRKVAGALGSDFKMRMKELRGDAIKVLEDSQVPVPSREQAEEVEPNRPSSHGWGLMGMGAGIEGAIRGLMKKQPEDEVLEHLRSDLERLAGKIGRVIFGPVVIFFINLLPLVALGDIIYRTGWAWVAGNYLPWNFYSMALLVFLASLLPGYLFLSDRIWRSAMVPNLREIVANIRQTEVTAPLRRARENTQALLENIRILGQQSHQVRSSLAHELDIPELGERTRTR